MRLTLVALLFAASCAHSMDTALLDAYIDLRADDYPRRLHELEHRTSASHVRLLLEKLRSHVRTKSESPEMILTINRANAWLAR